MSTAPRMTVRFTQPQWAYLQTMADDLGITVAELVRRIIDEYRTRKEK